MTKSNSSGERSRTIKNNIRRLRFENNQMTQERLADAAGVTRQTIIAVEADKYSPSLDLAFRIAKALGAKIEDVFQYQEDAASLR